MAIKPKRGKTAEKVDPNAISTIFGRVVKHEEKEERGSSINPFSFINDINFGKEYIYSDETKSSFEPYIITKAMSIFPDTLSDAIFLNSNHHLDEKMQHDYLFYKVIKRKRFKKDAWFKKSEDEKKELKILKDIGKIINYNLNETKRFWNMLTETQKKDFLEQYVYPDSRNKNK
jgi:hypothetical protein